MKKIYFTVMFWGNLIFSKLDYMSGDKEWSILFLVFAGLFLFLSFTESFSK
jgi:hypothetical protein